MMIFSLTIFTLIINYSAQNFVDLGHELSEDTRIFPIPELQKHSFKRTILHNGTTPEGYWVAYNAISLFEHIGTHVDAPYHFYEFGWSLEQIPFHRLISPAVVIDVTAKAAEDRNYAISVEDVENWIAENGLFPNNSVILGRTGWSKKFHNPDDYFGIEKEGPSPYNFPGFGVEAVKHIMNYKNTHDIHTVGFGTDTISLDHAPSLTYEAHQAVQKENQFIIENMNNLEALPLKGAILFVMPMKIRGGTGAPARIFAQLPSSEVQCETSVPLTDSPFAEDSTDTTVADDLTDFFSSSTSTTTSTPSAVNEAIDERSNSDSSA